MLERDLEAARRDVEALERTCATHKASASAASDEATQTRRIADAQVMRLQHELELSEVTRSELERQIATLCAQVDAAKGVQQQSDAAAASRAQLESELETLRSHASSSASALAAAETRHTELQAKCTELEQQVALLSADKRYLQDAKAQLEGHEAVLLTKQHNLLAKVDALQSAHERDVSESVRLQTETRLHFEQKLEAEVAKFLETSARELERIRSSGQVVYERENRLLKEARDDALQQTELLQTKLELAQRALEAKVRDAIALAVVVRSGVTCQSSAVERCLRRCAMHDTDCACLDAAWLAGAGDHAHGERPRDGARECPERPQDAAL